MRGVEVGDETGIVRRADRVQVRKARSDAWTMKKRKAFLRHLAATANVTQSAKAVGGSASGAQLVRRRDPAFAKSWAEAMATATETLETMLVASALGTLEGAAVILTEDGEEYPDPPEPDPSRFDPKLALELLKRIEGRAARPGKRPVKAASNRELADELMKRIEAVRKRRARAGAPLLPAPISEKPALAAPHLEKVALAAPQLGEAAPDDG